LAGAQHVGLAGAQHFGAAGAQHVGFGASQHLAGLQHFTLAGLQQSFANAPVFRATTAARATTNPNSLRLMVHPPHGLKNLGPDTQLT
jgi:hypothetical protein